MSANKTAKISDFGLSRFLVDNNYTKKSEIVLPWKWMAPECFESKCFSTYTDVWSYGITIWEFFSLGSQPYDSHDKFSPQFVNELFNGKILPQPNLATDKA